MDRGMLIDGALAVITTSGLRELSLTSVATEAGVSRASVYRAFGNRDALIEAVVERELATMQSILGARLRFSDDARATVTSLTREVLDYFDTHPALRAVLRHDGADLLPFLIDDGASHPTLVGLVTAAALTHIDGTPLADALRPDAPRGVEHMVRVIFSHLLIPSAAIDDKQVAALIADAVVE